MLVITTQEGEAIQIGEEVRILVRRVKGGWVRLCIDAPREIPIQRIEAPSEVEVAKRPKRVGEGT
jgi:carbon storage regulator